MKSFSILKIIAINLCLFTNICVNAQLYYEPQYDYDYKIQDDSLFNAGTTFYKKHQFNDALIAFEKISNDYMKSIRRDYIKDWKIACQQHLQNASVSKALINKHYLFEPINPHLLIEADSLYLRAVESMSKNEYILALDFLIKTSESEKSTIGALHFYRLSTLNDLYRLSQSLNEEKIILYALSEIYKIIENNLSYICYLKTIGFLEKGLLISQPKIKRDIISILDKFVILFSSHRFTSFLDDFDSIYAKFVEISSLLKLRDSTDDYNSVIKVLDKSLNEFKQSNVFNGNYVILSILRVTCYLINNETSLAIPLLNDIFDALLSVNVADEQFGAYYSFTLDRLNNNQQRFDLCGMNNFTKYVYRFYLLSKEFIVRIASHAPLYDSEYTNLMCSILPNLDSFQVKELTSFLLENLYLPEDLCCRVVKSQSNVLIKEGKYLQALEILENSLNNASNNFSLDSKITLHKDVVFILKNNVSNHAKYTEVVQTFISLCWSRINEYKEQSINQYEMSSILELYFNIAEIYEEEENWDDTIKIYLEAINIFREQFSPSYLCSIYERIIYCYLYKRDIAKVHSYIESYKETVNNIADERRKKELLNTVNWYKANIAELIEVDSEMKYHYHKRMLENSINTLQDYFGDVEAQNVIKDIIKIEFSELLEDQRSLGFFNVEDDCNMYLTALQVFLNENSQEYYETEIDVSLTLIDYYITIKNNKVKAKKMLDNIIKKSKKFNLKIKPYHLLNIAEYYYNCSNRSKAKSVYSTILDSTNESDWVYWHAKLELFKLQFSDRDNYNLKEWYITSLEYLSQKDLINIYSSVAEKAYSAYMLGKNKATKSEALKLLPYFEDICKKRGRKNLFDELYDLYILTENYTKAFECYNELLEIGETNRNKAIYIQSEQYRGEQFNDYFQKNIVTPSIIYNSVLERKNNSLEKSIAFENLIDDRADTILIQKYNSLLQLTQKFESDNKIIYKGKEISEEQAFIIIQTLYEDIEQRCYYLHNIDKNTKVQIDDIHNNLKTGEAAIEITSFVGFDKVKKLGAAIAINNKVIYIPLCSESKIEENETNIETLYQLIWEPILNQIEGCKCIYFSPDGIIHKIPFEIILATHNSDIRIFRVSTTREIVLSSVVNKNNNAVVFGGLSYNNVNNNKEISHNIDDIIKNFGKNKGVIDSLNVRSGIRYLPGSKEEADHISSLLRDNKFVTCYFTGVNGSESEFRGLSGQTNDIIHVATHGFYFVEGEYNRLVKILNTTNDSNTSYEDRILNRTGLLFAGVNKTLKGELLNESNDGILLGSDISKLDFRFVDLVVLSACQTGLGDIEDEGVYGLQRAFKKAGANSILMSLWNVDDKATLILMKKFYENIISGMNKVDALTHAQKYLKNYENTVEIEIVNDMGITEKKTKTIKPYEEYKFWAPYIILDAIDR